MKNQSKNLSCANIAVARKVITPMAARNGLNAIGVRVRAASGETFQTEERLDDR